MAYSFGMEIRCIYFGNSPFIQPIMCYTIDINAQERKITTLIGTLVSLRDL